MRPLMLIGALGLFAVGAVLIVFLVRSSDPPSTARPAPTSASPPGTQLAVARIEGERELRIAILDFARIHQQSQAIEAIEAGYRRAIQAYADEAKAREAELRAEEIALRQQEGTMSAEEYRGERSDLQRRMARAMELVQERKRTLDLARQEALNEVQLALNEIVTQIATEQKLSLILRKEQTVLVAIDFDITDEVLRRLNARLPSADVFAPEN